MVFDLNTSRRLEKEMGPRCQPDRGIEEADGVRVYWASARGGPVRAGREPEELGLGLLRPEEEEGKGMDWA